MSRSDPAPPAYDPELPFLAALEDDVRRRAEAALSRDGAPAVATRPRPARRRARMVVLGRATRRVGSLAGLLLLIGATAYAIVGVRSSRQSPVVILGHGTRGGERWTARVWRRGGTLCRELSIGATEQSACEPRPGPRSLTLLRVESPAHDWVLGVAGPRVPSVVVTAARSRRRVAAQPFGARVAAATRLAAGDRWFVTAVVRDPGARPPTVAIGPRARERRRR